MAIGDFNALLGQLNPQLGQNPFQITNTEGGRFVLESGGGADVGAQLSQLFGSSPLSSQFQIAQSGPDTFGRGQRFVFAPMGGEGGPGGPFEPPGPPTGPPPSAPPPFPPTVPPVPIEDFGGPQFLDPGTAVLEDLLKLRLGELFAQRDNPGIQQQLNFLQGQVEVPDPFFSNLIHDIGTRMGQLQTPGQLQSDVEQRIAQLREAPFSAGEEELIRTEALDRIGRTQDSAERRLLEQVGALGRAPTSGANADLLRLQGQEFTSQRADAERAFGLRAAEERQRRLNQALELRQFMDADERGRLDQALGLSGQLQQLGQGRRDEQIDAANIIAAIEEQVRLQEEGRRREAVSLAGMLSGLPERRLQLAMSALGTQAPPPPLFDSLAQLMGLNQNQQQLALQAQIAAQNAAAQRRSDRSGLALGLGGLIPTIFPQLNQGQGG